MDYRLIYLARRNPAIAAEAFGAAWRSHADYAQRIAPDFGAHFRSARQCLKVAVPDLPASFRSDYDGASLMGMVDHDALVAARTHPIAADELLRDEDRVFAERVAPRATPTRAETVVRGSGGRAFILSFVKRRADLDQASFDAAVDRACAALAGMDGLTGLVRHRVLEPPPPPEDFAAILELRFTDEAEALRAARTPEIVALIEQARVADVAAGVRMVARLNDAA